LPRYTELRPWGRSVVLRSFSLRYSPECVEKLFGNSERIPNGDPKAAKMSRRCPDRATIGAKDMPSRRLQLFSKQFRNKCSRKFTCRILDKITEYPTPMALGQPYPRSRRPILSEGECLCTILDALTPRPALSYALPPPALSGAQVPRGCCKASVRTRMSSFTPSRARFKWRASRRARMSWPSG
jgi:hypothetical protein